LILVAKTLDILQGQAFKHYSTSPVIGISEWFTFIFTSRDVGVALVVHDNVFGFAETKS
jgi:hypothetical protein